MNINEKKAENTPAGGVLVGKKDGQTIIHDEGTMSGYLVGKLHKDGGIKAVNKATGQPLEMQGGEVVITAPAVSDQTKREFEGKMMTNREILSAINEKGGGVSFANGGDIPAKINTTDCEYKLGGKVVKDTDIAHSLGMNSTLKKGKQQFSSGDTTYDVDAIYNAIKKGKLRLKTKEVETFPMKYPVYDKKYSETVKTDFRKPNGITVRTESGEEVLIDGNHRMNNAYLKGRKTMKTYYIEDPKQIAKFTKKNKFELGGENKMGGHLSSGKSLKQIAEMHNVSLAHINEELAKGLEVEKEHFADFKERTRVAKDHLVENPNYYTILEKAGLKNGGHILSHHRHSDNLVKDAKSGNTPARDLNNYNDVMDLEADGMVSMESGLAFAKGGQVSNFFKKTYGNLVEKQGIITTKTDWFNKDGVKVLEYGFDPYRYEKGNTLFFYSWDYDDSGMDYDDFKEQLVDFFKKTYKKDVSELKALYVGWDRKEKDTYADGGITPYDANLEGDSVDIVESDFAKGGVVYDTTKPKLEKVTIKESKYGRESIVGRNASNVKELQDIIIDYVRKSTDEVDWIKFYVNDATRGSYYIDLNKGKKNTVKNVNTETVNAQNIKRVIDAKDYLVKNYDWTDFFEGASKGMGIDPNVIAQLQSLGVNVNQLLAPKTKIPVILNNSVQQLVKTPTGQEIPVIVLPVNKDFDGKYSQQIYIRDWRGSDWLVNTFANIKEQICLTKVIAGKIENGIFEVSTNISAITLIEEKVTKRYQRKIVFYQGLEALSKMKDIISKDLPLANLTRTQTPTSTSTVSKELDLSGTKVWLGDDSKLNEEIQKSAFSLGWQWSGGKIVQYTNADAIYFDNAKRMGYKVGGRYAFDNNPNKELNPQEILLATKPTITNTSTKQYPEYYEYIGAEMESFTRGKIYKINNPNDLEAEGNFIANDGTTNGFSGSNFEKFKPSTEQAFLAQQSGGSSTSTKTPLTKEELYNSRIWIGDNVELRDKVIAKLEEIGIPFDKYSGNAVADESIDINIFSNDFVVYKESKEEFDKDTKRKEIFLEDLGIDVTTMGVAPTTANALTSAKPFDFSMTKIDVSNNPDLSLRVQKKAFEDGWEWENGGGKNTKNDPFNYMYFTKTSISFGNTFSSFNNSPKREITEADIFGSQAPVYDNLVKKLVVSVTEKNSGNNEKVEIFSTFELYELLNKKWRKGKYDAIVYPTGNFIVNESFHININTKFWENILLDLPEEFGIEAINKELEKKFPNLNFDIIFKKDTEEVFKVTLNYDTGTQRTLVCNNGSELFSAYRIIEDEAEGGSLDVVSILSLKDKYGSTSQDTQPAQEVGQGGFMPSQIYSYEDFEKIAKGMFANYDLTNFFSGVNVGNSSVSNKTIVEKLYIASGQGFSDIEEVRSYLDNEAYVSGVKEVIFRINSVFSDEKVKVDLKDKKSPLYYKVDTRSNNVKYGKLQEIIEAQKIFTKYDWEKLFTLTTKSQSTNNAKPIVESVLFSWKESGLNFEEKTVRTPEELFNLVKEAYNLNLESVNIQPLGNSFVTGTSILSSRLKDIVLSKTFEEAEAEFMSELQFGIFPELDFSEFIRNSTSQAPATNTSSNVVTSSGKEVFQVAVGYKNDSTGNTGSKRKYSIKQLYDFLKILYVDYDKFSSVSIFPIGKDFYFNNTDAKGVDIYDNFWKNILEDLSEDDAKDAISKFLITSYPELNFDDYSGLKKMSSTVINKGSNLAPFEASQVTLEWRDNLGILVYRNFFTKDFVKYGLSFSKDKSGQEFIDELKNIEKQRNGKDVELIIRAYAQDNDGKEIERFTEFNIGEKWFKPSERTNEEIKSIVENDWIDGITFEKFFEDVIPLSTTQNINFKLDPNEVGLVTLTYKDKNGTDVQNFSYKGSDLITELEKIETDGQGVGIEVNLIAYSSDDNGKTFSRNLYITVGGNYFRPIGKTPELIKSSIESWFQGLNFDKFFDGLVPFNINTYAPQTPTVSGSSGSVQEINDLKQAVGVLEGIASQASQKYNTKKYDENLELLKEVKEEYELALSFTPESSFMYERIELMKKITEIQKEITRITELKNGGAFYILSKVIERLDKGEDWKQLGNGEIMVNEVPPQEIDAVIYTEKFKNWFGDWEKALVTKEYDYVSKVLTESGKPCVMYHGAKRIKYSYRQVSNGVLYLAENRSYAEWFSATDSPYQKQGDYLTQCFVNIKNPIDLTPFGVEEVDLRDIIQYIDTLYPLAKIYDVLPPNVAMAIMNNQLIGRNFRAWYIIRQFPELNQHIRDNTTYDGFIYYENNPSDMIINESGEMVENVTKATAVFKSNQVKLVDAMLFDGSLDDWRFEKGGKVN